MDPRERLISAFVAAFVVLKVAEGLLALEAWPLSHVPMFAVRQPPEARPVRLSIQALRGGRWFEMLPWQLGLNRAELDRRLLAHADPGTGCGELLRAFNGSRPRQLRLAAAYVRRDTVARPGTDAADVVERFDCPLDAEVP